MKAKEVMKLLLKDGWYQKRQNGSHKQLAHPVKKGTVTVPMLGGDIPIGTLKSILRQAGLN